LAGTPFRVKLVLMLEKHHVAVNVNDIFAVQGDAVLSLVFLAYAFWKKPVQNRKVNVQRLEFPTLKL